jgi:hypothetical protein
MKSNFILFVSIIAIKINELVYLNPSISTQNSTNIDSISKLIALIGLITIGILLLFLWKKVFRFQNLKESDKDNPKLVKKTMNNSGKNKGLIYIKFFNSTLI